MTTSPQSFDLHSRARAPRHKCALAIMAKAPLAGTVKTRLVPPLNAQEAAALSACFLQDTAANVSAVAGLHGADCIAVYTPVDAEEVFHQLLPAEFRLLPQNGAQLGDRLLNATEELLAFGYESVCLINGDTPTLPPTRLVDAIQVLRRPGDQVVLGPADDGGYYLIGLKQPHQLLFTDIPWSTPHVYALTVDRAHALNLAPEVLSYWYDLDDASSLRRLCNELFSPNGTRYARNGESEYEPHHTRAFLEQIIAAEGRERLWPSVPPPMI